MEDLLKRKNSEISLLYQDSSHAEEQLERARKQANTIYALLTSPRYHNKPITQRVFVSVVQSFFEVYGNFSGAPMFPEFSKEGSGAVSVSPERVFTGMQIVVDHFRFQSKEKKKQLTDAIDKMLG